VHNAACVAALGADNPSYMSYSIATPTGEASPRADVYRERQIALGGGALRII